MATTAVEDLIISSIRGAFVKYPEGDGINLDYEWITRESQHTPRKGDPRGFVLERL